MDGKIDMIITKSIPRFARNTLDTLRYVRLLREKNVAIYFEVEKINTLVDGEFLMTILSSVAQQEVENTSAYVKKGLKMKMKRGELVGFSRCFGYDRDKETGELKIVESEAETVRHIFDRYLQGAGGTVIARELNEEGILTYNHCQWTCSIILNIIKNEKYMGDMLQGKTYTVDPISKRRLPNNGEEDKFYVEGHHEPIVSEETFEKAQSLQVRHVRKSKFDKDITLLSGYVKCGNCRRNLTGSKKLHGHILYSCAYSQGKEDTGCFAGKADDKMLEQIVLAEIKAYLRQNISQEQMQQSMREQHEDNIQEYKLESQECENRQEEIRIQNRRNYEKYHEGQMDQKQFMEAKKQLEEEKERLQRRGQELDELINGEKEILMKKNVPVEQMLKFLGYEKLKQEMLEEYVQGIYVYDDGRVEVEWKELSKKAVRNRIEVKKDF